LTQQIPLPPASRKSSHQNRNIGIGVVAVLVVVLLYVIFFVPLIPYTVNTQEAGTRNLTYSLSDYYPDVETDIGSNPYACINLTNTDNKAGTFQVILYIGCPAARYTFPSQSQVVGAGQTVSFTIGPEATGYTLQNSPSAWTMISSGVFNPNTVVISSPSIQYTYNVTHAYYKTIIRGLA
jgi:hypothetical protein